MGEAYAALGTHLCVAALADGVDYGTAGPAPLGMRTGPETGLLVDYLIMHQVGVVKHYYGVVDQGCG